MMERFSLKADIKQYQDELIQNTEVVLDKISALNNAV